MTAEPDSNAGTAPREEGRRKRAWKNQYGLHSRTLEERLMQRAVRDPATGCLIWQGCTTEFGHGLLRDPGLRQSDRTHRIMWRLRKGPIPRGKCVLHSCDNPPCIEIEHLFLGTRLDNNRDMTAKGRHWRHGQTHCKHGHPWDPDNTQWGTRNGLRFRRCRACRAEEFQRSKGRVAR